MPLDRQWIEQHIAHKGRMCLLDEVLSWDAARIRCRSATHRSADNPLRLHGRLGAACGIEYAAQAMAVHEALIAASAPLTRTVATSVRGSIGSSDGYLASVRNVSLRVERLDDLEADLIAAAARLTGDAATRASLEAVLEQGPIQILVNNAGVHDDAVLPGMSATQWQRVIDVSVNGFFNATQPLLLPMIRTRWGRIVNVSSVAALIGNKGQVNYAAAKGALNSATKALALEVATRGITVNSVAPGIIGPPMPAGLFDAKAIERLVPMNRLGSPEEVAALVSFLVSEEAAYVTAQVISVSGGMA